MTAPSESAGSPAPAPTRPPSATRWPLVIGALVLVVILIVAGLYVARVGPFASSSSGPSYQTGSSGAFTQGQVVTLPATGNFLCTPGVASFYPAISASAVGTECEVGGADQNAVVQIPQWILIPAFAGLSVFGSGHGGTPAGYPVAAQGSAAVLTDCGAGGSSSACPDNPGTLYIHALDGAGGSGIVPMPAHDILLNTSTTVPNVEWGSIFVLVFDPFIFPDRSTGSCAGIAGANASNTANCLSSYAALDRALGTDSSAVAAFNGCSGCRDAGATGFWSLFGQPTVQAILVGSSPSGPDEALTSNLYVPYSVQPGVPTFP